MLIYHARMCRPGKCPRVTFRNVRSVATAARMACTKWRRSCRQHELLPISHPTQCLAAGVPVHPGAAPQICQTAGRHSGIVPEKSGLAVSHLNKTYERGLWQGLHLTRWCQITQCKHSGEPLSELFKNIYSCSRRRCPFLRVWITHTAHQNYCVKSKSTGLNKLILDLKLWYTSSMKMVTTNVIHFHSH